MFTRLFNFLKTMGSKQQSLLKEKVQSILINARIISDYRSKHLINFATGKSYEIDLYIPLFNVGIEFQGAVHFESLSRYNNNPDKSRLNDNIKNDFSVKTKTVPFALIEMFAEDLKSKDFKELFLFRLQNTLDLYLEYKKYLGCAFLEKMKIFIINSLDCKYYACGKNGLVYNSNSDQAIKNNNIDLTDYTLYKNLASMQVLRSKASKNSKYWYKTVYNYAKEKGLVEEYCKYIIAGNNDAEVHYNLTLKPADELPDIKRSKYSYIKMLEQRLLREKKRLNILSDKENCTT